MHFSPIHEEGRVRAMLCQEGLAIDTLEKNKPSVKPEVDNP